MTDVSRYRVQKRELCGEALLRSTIFHGDNKTCAASNVSSEILAAYFLELIMDRRVGIDK